MKSGFIKALDPWPKTYRNDALLYHKVENSFQWSETITSLGKAEEAHMVWMAQSNRNVQYIHTLKR